MVLLVCPRKPLNMHKDAREGGENPPLPRNCKRVFLRLVF
jgi:hypothetical protein